jgi:hypothetical protein
VTPPRSSVQLSAQQVPSLIHVFFVAEDTDEQCTANPPLHLIFKVLLSLCVKRALLEVEIKVEAYSSLI